MTVSTYDMQMTYSVNIGDIDMTNTEKEQLEKDRWHTIVRKFGVKIIWISFKEVDNAIH